MSLLRSSLKLVRRVDPLLAGVLLLWLFLLPGAASGQDEEPAAPPPKPVDVQANDTEPRDEAGGAGTVVEGGNAGVQKADGEEAGTEPASPPPETPSGEQGGGAAPQKPDAQAGAAIPPPKEGDQSGATPQREPNPAGNVADSGPGAAEPRPPQGGKGVPGGSNVPMKGPNVGERGTRPANAGELKPPPEGAQPPLKGAQAPPRGGGLPSFAEGQPGFIPDTSPSDLFDEKRREIYIFTSPLGQSKLPKESTSDIISSSKGQLAGKLPENYARVVVPTGTIEGSTETKQFHIEGGLIIYYKDVSISGQVADIDEKNEVARLSGDVNIVDPKYHLKTDELNIYFNDKKFHATGFISFSKVADKKRAPDLSLPKKDRLRKYFAAQEFELYCQDLYYDWDTLEMTAVGSVRLVHPSFNGTMDRVDYNDETKHYTIEGNVLLEVSDYNWIFSNKLVDTGDEQKVRAITDGPTKIHCARLVYSEDTGVAEFYALPGEKVSFEQPKRTIKAAYMEVNDNTKDYYAEGDDTSQVEFHQTNGDWLIKGGLITKEGVAPELDEMLSGEVTAKANTLAYNFDRKRIELKGGVDVTGSNKTLTAQNLVQDQTSDYFLLQGNVTIRPDKDSTIYAAQVFVDTKSDVVTFVGLVEGRIKSDEIPTTEETAEGEGGAGGQGQLQIQQGVFQQVGTPGTTRSRSSSNVADR